jgi:hypothetical protein
MPLADSGPADGPGPEFRPSQEVRLAVVMYGGVSLACYLNGVAQELYHLVRSTAPAADGPAGAAPPRGVAAPGLSATQTVYRNTTALAGGRDARRPRQRLGLGALGGGGRGW